MSIIFRKCQLGDLEAIDIGFFNSLKYVEENDPEPLDLNFSVLEETFGEVGGAYKASQSRSQANFLKKMAWGQG